MTKPAPKAAAAPAAAGRRCESCGRFLPASRTEPLCASCAERGKTIAVQVAAFPETGKDDAARPRRALPNVPPSSSWPPRAQATAPPSSADLLPAPTTLTERGIIIPRPSELHPARKESTEPPAMVSAAPTAPRSSARRNPMQATPVSATRHAPGVGLRGDAVRIAIQVLIALAIGIVVGVAIPFLMSR